MNKRVVIGTRGSALALWQAETVRDALAAAHPGLEVELRIVKTTGDINLKTPMAEIGDKGLFTKELEVELLEGRIDICVHSMKDMPTDLPEGCSIIAMLERADVRDALICGPRVAEAHELSELPEGARIATGSLRRAAQLRAAYPNIVPQPIRGNVDTRLSKAKGPDYEGAILAAAGVTRLGRADEITAYLSVDEMVPAVGQGAIGIEARTGDDGIAALCDAINCPTTFACVSAERNILAALEGGCQVPMGAYLREEGDAVVGDAIVASLDGSAIARSRMSIPLREGSHQRLAVQMTQDLLAEGAGQILFAIREGQE